MTAGTDVLLYMDKQGATSMVKFEDIYIGDVVQVRTCFGTGVPIRARVVGVDINIKNGQPGIDYVPFAGGRSQLGISAPG